MNKTKFKLLIVLFTIIVVTAILVDHSMVNLLLTITAPYESVLINVMTIAVSVLEFVVCWLLYKKVGKPVVDELIIELI